MIILLKEDLLEKEKIQKILQTQMILVPFKVTNLIKNDFNFISLLAQNLCILTIFRK